MSHHAGNGLISFNQPGRALVVQGDALRLPLPDGSVDLIVTSPPYFALRSYSAGPGEIGSEPTPTAYLEALWAATAEMGRVLKPSGSIFVDLGDSYARDGGVGKSRSLDGAGKGSEGQRMRTRLTQAEMTREQAAWLAGMIDSDGSISIKLNKQQEGRAPSFVPWVRIGQMMPEAVQHAAAITGIGSAFQDARGCWNWAAASQQARWVLERIYPWLLIKKRQCAAAIEVARHVEERNGRGTYRPLTAADVTYRRRLLDTVQTWNRGEHDPLEPPEPRTVPLPLYPLPPREKSLNLLPEQYRLGCIGYLGLIARAVICWSKPNGLPESVTDRVRRSHEDWVHLTKQPRYYAAVDEIRQPYSDNRPLQPARNGRGDRGGDPRGMASLAGSNLGVLGNGLGALPGSVWSIPSEPLRLPDHLGVDHYASFPSEWPRRLILGWSPPGICLECGQGRVPVVERPPMGGFIPDPSDKTAGASANGPERNRRYREHLASGQTATILGYACSCTPFTDHAGTGGDANPDRADGAGRHNFPKFADLPGRQGPWREYHLDGWKPPPTRPAIVVDVFGGTGTVAGVARQLDRIGISIDLSHSYSRAARYRIFQSGDFGKAISRTNLERQGTLL